MKTMSEYWWLLILLPLTVFYTPNDSQSEVWIPENEFISYMDRNGIFTVVGVIKNSEEFPIIPTITINVQDGEQLFSKSFEYVPIQPSKELPFKIKFPEIKNNSPILLEPTISFTPTIKEPLQIEVLYDDSLIKHDDGHLTGRIINNGNFTVHNIKIFAIIHGYDEILDMAQNIEMIEKLEPGEIRNFSMYPDPSVTSQISYYSCFAPSDTTIVPMTAIRNDEKFFFRYDAGTWYYDAQFNEEGTELTMKTQTSFNLDTYASFEFPFYTNNENFQVYLNDKKKNSIQSKDEMGNWHVSFGVGPRETGLLRISGFEQGWTTKNIIIPDWVRNNAKWWSNDTISDSEFVKGIQFLIDEKIVVIPKYDQRVNLSSVAIPSWIKFNAGWWADGMISDREFTKGLEFLIKSEIIRFDSKNNLPTSSKIIETIPATSNTILNFYVNDQDLNTSPNGIDTVSTEGLIQITINGVLIKAPSQMVETTPNSGKFFLRITLPETVDGKPLQKDDVVLVKYIDQSDHAGEKKIIEKSIVLSSSFAQVESSGGANRIGREFSVRLYEPDANRDSKDEDKIPLSALEFRAEGGIRTTLANPIFQANSAFLIETGPNSNIFEVKIKIPRSVDGKTIHIGDWYEIRYFDSTNPSETTEKIVLKGKIG